MNEIFLSYRNLTNYFYLNISKGNFKCKKFKQLLAKLVYLLKYKLISLYNINR